MNDLQFKEDGSPRFQEYDIVNLGRTGFVEVRSVGIAVERAKTKSYFNYSPDMWRVEWQYLSCLVSVKGDCKSGGCSL